MSETEPEWLHGVLLSVIWMGRSHAPPALQLINSNYSQHGASVETDSHCVEAPLARPRRCLRASQDQGPESAVPEGFVAGDYRLAAECSLCNHCRSKSKGQAGELYHWVDIWAKMAPPLTAWYHLWTVRKSGWHWKLIKGLERVARLPQSRHHLSASHGLIILLLILAAKRENLIKCRVFNFFQRHFQKVTGSKQFCRCLFWHVSRPSFVCSLLEWKAV